MRWNEHLHRIDGIPKRVLFGELGARKPPKDHPKRTEELKTDPNGNTLFHI